MTLFAEAVLVSVYANSEALLICVAGAYALHRQIIGPADLKSFSKMLLEVMFPIFAFSNFRVYSLEMLQKWYMASVGSAVILVIGAILGRSAAWLLRLRSPYVQILVLSTTFGNCGALPYVLLPPIVSNWRKVSADSEDALVEGFAVISLFAMVWTLALFFLGRPYALTMKAKEPSSSPSPPTTPSSSASSNSLAMRLKKVDLVVWMALLGILVGCVAPLRDALSERAEIPGPLRFVGSFSFNFGRAAVPLSTMILGGSLYTGGLAEWHRRRATRDADAELGVEEGPEEGPEEGSEGSQLARLAISAGVLKLLVMPAITIPLLLLALRAGVLPKDQPMLFMVLMLQTGVPSAQTALALLVAAGLQKQAGKMSIVYLPMYVASVLTLAVVIVLAVTYSEELS